MVCKSSRQKEFHPKTLTEHGSMMRTTVTLERLKRRGYFSFSEQFQKSYRSELQKLEFHNKTQRSIQDLAILLNPKIRNWINYYGKISRR